MVSAGSHGGGGHGNGGDDSVVVDFRGNPVDKARTGGWLGAGLILGTESAERVYLVGDLHLSNAKSANIVTNFMGTLNLLALLGGFLADAKLGRYLTVVVSVTIAAIANVSGFGSDQFDGRDPREEKAMLFFFNRVYSCISLGSLLAVTALVYVQEDVGRGWGYGASAASTVAAVAVFAAGTPWYRYRRPQGSPLTAIGRVL